MVALRQGVRLTSVAFNIIILSRLIPPADYGMLSFAMVLWSILAGLRGMGIREVIITAEHPDRLDLLHFSGKLRAQAWWLAGICLIASPCLAWWYHPMVGLTLAALGLSWIPTSLTVIGESFAERAFQQTALTKIEVAINLSGMLCGGLLAWHGAGLAALIANILIPELVRSFLIRRRLVADLPVVDLRHPGDLVLSQSLISHGNRRQWSQALLQLGGIQNWIIGATAGSHALGEFSRMRSMTSTVIDQIFRPWAKYGFTIDARRAEKDPQDPQYLRILGWASGTGGLTALVGSLVVDDLLPFLLGPLWAGATPLLKVLLPGIWTGILTMLLDWRLVHHQTSFPRRSYSLTLVALNLSIVALLLSLSISLTTTVLAALVMQTLVGITWQIHSLCKDTGFRTPQVALTILPGGLIAFLPTIGHPWISNPWILLPTGIAGMLLGMILPPRWSSCRPS